MRLMHHREHHKGHNYAEQRMMTGEEGLARRAHLDGGPQLKRVLHLGDLEEVLVVGDAQRAHAVLVAPLLEVPLERAPPPVARPAADLALELLRIFSNLSEI